jgi:hypothetical protein
MANPKPTEGWAAYGKDGFQYAVPDVGPGEVSAQRRGSVVIPVTIIPTSDLVREAARVLLGWKASNHMEASAIIRAAVHEAGEDQYVFDEVLRALAGQGGE